MLYLRFYFLLHLNDGKKKYIYKICKIAERKEKMRRDDPFASVKKKKKYMKKEKIVKNEK